MTKGLIVALTFLLVVGCDRYNKGHFSSGWNEQKIENWMTKVKHECAPSGYAMDRSSGGYSYMSEIRQCPDGTLAILPID